ncbi:prepilin-type N-terminal cleavage/methylation domain-containing protein [Crenobacter cavernae]|uniref:Prepilin-type N-terminal cleavage/methylation domain-containing protein n=1 Tax=Crenobacter cavernae TaxID=2290923 RepID=A0ABY0FCB0_9NEIS|nr:prepilin-type N-terminal cleavage/methylation domain-containing protein [Crenobacter cavernae]RXZ43648.1 prepilin-type N-terminal cleavage/methylation domain-containing protein [Crenobacter cavernae]
MKHHFHAQDGFSLIELMVAVALSLVVLAAVSASYLSGRQASHAAEERLALQQDARLALTVLSRDLRMAGVFGCAVPALSNIERKGAAGTTVRDNLQLVSHYASDATDQFDSNALGFRAVSAQGSAWMSASPVAATSPMLVVQFGQGTAAINGSSTVVASDGIAWMNRLDTTPPPERAVNASASYLAISSCARIDFVKVDGDSVSRGASDGLQLVFGNNDRLPVGKSATVSGHQGGSLDVMRFVSRAYVVGSYQGEKALYMYERAENGALVGPIEIAPNVSKLDAEYGTVNACEGASAGLSITYTKEPDDWRKVDLVRLLITMESPRPAAVASIDGAAVSSRQYSTTVALRGSNLCANQAKFLAGT